MGVRRRSSPLGRVQLNPSLVPQTLDKLADVYRWQGRGTGSREETMSTSGGISSADTSRGTTPASRISVRDVPASGPCSHPACEKSPVCIVSVMEQLVKLALNVAQMDGVDKDAPRRRMSFPSLTDRPIARSPTRASLPDLCRFYPSAPRVPAGEWLPAGGRGPVQEKGCHPSSECHPAAGPAAGKDDGR